MKNLIAIVLIFFAFSTYAQTYSLTGSVKDQKGEPLPGATVFLTNTKNATSTDGSGKFVLGEVQPGTYELVVNMIGFNPSRQNIKIEKATDVTIKLFENSILLNAVTINATRDKQPKRYYDWFNEGFLGWSTNASKCKILNPDVLNFHYAKGILSATANDFLILENNALGYKIKYLLKEFKFYPNNGNACYYDGNAYFEELPGTPEQQQQWKQNRRKAYLGSMHHFFRAIVNHTSRAEGFFVTYNTLWPKQSGSKLGSLNIDTTLVPISQNFKALIGKKEILGRKDTTRLELYIRYVDPLSNKVSVMKQFVDTVIIDKNGGTDPGMGFGISGYWSVLRVAELTPLDYFVDPIAEKKAQEESGFIEVK